MQNKLQQFDESTPTQGNSDEEPKLQQKQKKEELVQQQQELQKDLVSDQDFYYFKIPKLQKSQSELTLIGIIDSSGSMYQYWSHLAKAWNEFQKITPYSYAICFSDNASMRGNLLSSKQSDHGGGSTNIEAGFRELMRCLVSGEIKLTQQIAIVFISDGQDNNSSTIIQRLSELDFTNIRNKYQIQFTSIGCGQGFPTHMAITLRDLLHNSNPNTPFLTLVSIPQEIEWKFPTLREFIQIGDRYQTNQEILNFPWDQRYKTYVEASDWVMSKEKQLQIFLKEGQLEKTLEGQQKLDLKDVIYIGASWMQELQLKSLRENVSKQAIMALQLLENMLSKFELNVIDYKKLTVYQRRKLLKNKDAEGEYYQVIEQIKKLANSQFISSLSDQQAAQRLQIRTQVGKYHNKAMKFAGLTLDQFEEAQSEFIKLLTENDLKGEIQQEPSFVSLQNTLDILQEQDLKDAISECQSQYELVDCFPIIGQGLYVKRTDASMINPYLTEVVSITKHHKILDSMALLQKNYDMTLQTGNGDIEKVNCLLPLFKDDLIRPFIKSKVYQILMTYNVQRNVDTLFPEAYLALMSSTLIHLIYQEDSEWKYNMLEEIRQTLRKVYDDEQEILIIRQQIQANQPRQILMQENKELVTFCQDPIKILLIAFAFDLMNQDVAEGIMIEIMARLNDNKVCDYFTFKVNENFVFDKEQIHQFIYEELNRETLLQNHYSFNEVYKSLKDCNDKVKIKLGQFDYYQQVDLQNDKLEFMRGRFNFEKLQKIYYFMVQKELTQDQIVQLLFHATEHDRAPTRANKPIVRDMEAIYNQIKGYKIQKDNLFNYDRVKLREEYKNHIYQQMVETHKIAIPLPYKDQYEEEHLQTNQLINNACMSKDCPYYKQVRKDYEDHKMSYKTFFLSDSAYSLIQLNCEKEPQEIMNIIYKHRLIKAQDRYIIRKRPIYVLDTIEQSKKNYKK